MLTYKVILVAMSTVSGGLLRKPHYPYPLVYVRGGGSTQSEDQKGKRIDHMKKKIDSK